MARPGFLADNIFRSYPIIHCRENGMPDCAISDFGSTTLAGSGYVEGTHEVWLEWIRRLDRTIEFAFRSDAPGLVDQMLIFQRDIDDPDFVTSFTWAQTVLTQQQLEEACECGANWICNSGFDEFTPPTTTTTTPPPGSSSPDIVPNCDKYPGSAVFGWDVSSGVTQGSGLLKMTVAPLSTETAEQFVAAFFPGQDLKLFFDLVSHDGNTSSLVTVGLASPTGDDVLISLPVTKTGTYQLNLAMPASGLIYVTIRVNNSSPSTALHVELDNVTLQACVSSDSSFFVGGPPEECPSDSLWEGFLVTGDLECLTEQLEDCTRAGATPGGFGEADILFLTDTTGSMGGYIATIKAIFEPLANSVTAALPNVDFRWSACSYKDYEDGGVYANGVSIDRAFTPSIPDVQTAINGWTASGGGDGPEQNLSALKIVAEQWLNTLSGRPDSQKAIIWGGDVRGHESGAKGNPYPGLTETIATLTSLGVKVFGINSRGAGDGIDGVGTPSGSRQASSICNATAGILSNSISQDDAEKIADLVATNIIITSSVPGAVTVSLLEGPGYIEPSRTKSLDGSYIRSFAVANAPRTRATEPDGCRTFCWGNDPDYCVICECIAGDVRFTEGYNSSIRIDVEANAIVLEAELGAGEGMPCEEVPSCPTDSILPGKTTLSGSDTCLEVVRSINGSGKRFFDLIGGQGVTVTPFPLEHRIAIDVGLHDLALCPDLAPDVLVECITPSADPCVCGPGTEPFVCPEGVTTTAAPSTTTTPDPACGGPCVWTWVQPIGETGAWSQISGVCSGTCACVEPSTDGIIHGEQRSTNCIDTVAPCILINSEFDNNTVGDAGNIVTLPGWDFDDNDPETGSHGPILLSLGGFALYPIVAQGNVIRLLATPDGNVTLKQNITVTPEKVYIITAYVSRPTGRQKWGASTDSNVFNDATILPPISTDSSPGAAGDSGKFEIIKIGVPAGVTTITIFFQSDKFLNFDGRGILDVAGVCVEQQA